MINMKAATIKYFSRVLFIIAALLFLFVSNISAQKKYIVNYLLSGKDTSYNLQQLGLKTSFDGKEFATVYLNTLPATLVSKGFPAASIDSVIYDSTHATINLYLGDQYKWVEINTDSVDEKLLESTGWNEKQFKNKTIDFVRLQQQEEKILSYYENNGYPFAEVSLNNIELTDNKIKGALEVKNGPLYHIDSIR